jgi:hypothetical protein
MKQKLRIRHRKTGCWLLLEPRSDAWVPAGRPEWATVFESADTARDAAAALKLNSSEYQITSRLQDFASVTN